MSSYFVSTQRNWLWVSVAALVLLVVALVLPQLAWADHASDHTDVQSSISPSGAYAALVEQYRTGELVYNAPGRRDDRSFSISPSVAFAALVEQYRTGQLVYNAPGRRDDRSFSISPSAAYAALIEQYKTGELVFNTPGRRDDRSFSASLNPAQTDATFLAANPEAMVYRRFVAAQQAAGAAASSARWVALGEFYTDSDAGLLAEFHTDSDAAFLAANPEIRAFRYNLAQQDCSESGPQC